MSGSNREKLVVAALNHGAGVVKGGGNTAMAALTGMSHMILPYLLQRVLSHRNIFHAGSLLSNKHPQVSRASSGDGRKKGKSSLVF